MSEFKALHQSRAARKGVQDATLETHRHTSGNPPSPDRLESVGCVRILATPPPPPSSGSFSIRQAALRYLAPWVPSRRVSDQISIPFWFLPSHPILETRTLMVSRAVSSRPLTQQRRCPSKRCPRPFMSSRTRVGEGLFSHLKFSAHAACPGQCPTPWMLAATCCGGQTRLPGRARKPPSVSNPTGRKGEKTRCHQFPRDAGADKRAQNNHLPVRLLDRSERVSANKNADNRDLQHFNTACCSLGCLLSSSHPASRPERDLFLPWPYSKPEYLSCQSRDICHGGKDVTPMVLNQDRS